MGLKEGLQENQKKEGLVGGIFAGLQESIGAVTDAAKELGWEKMKIFGEQLSVFRDAFDQVIQKGDAVIDKLLSNPVLVEKYNSLSHSSLLRYLWVNSLSSFLGNTFSSNYNARENLSLWDHLEKQYLDKLISADPNLWQQHKKAIRDMMRWYKELHYSGGGKTLAEELGIKDSEHPATSIHLEPIITTLVDRQAEFPINPAIIAQLPNGSSFVQPEWSGKDKHYVFKKTPLDKTAIASLCLSTSRVLMNNDQLALLRLFVGQHEGSNYSDVFAMTLFAYMRGVNTWYVAYDSDHIATEALSGEQLSTAERSPTPVQWTQAKNVTSTQKPPSTPPTKPDNFTHAASTAVSLDLLNFQKRLESITLPEGITLARKVFGAWPATDLLIALTKRYGAWSPALIIRYIMLGWHEGRLQFGHVNSDPNKQSGQFNWSTFQLSAKPSWLISKINNSINSGIKLASQAWIDTSHYQIHRFTPSDLQAMQRMKAGIYKYSSSRDVLAQHDLIAHLWYTYNIRGNIDLISQLADPSIKGKQLASLVSDKIQVWDPSIGQDVAFNLPKKSIQTFLS